MRFAGTDKKFTKIHLQRDLVVNDLKSMISDEIEVRSKIGVYCVITPKMGFSEKS